MNIFVEYLAPEQAAQKHAGMKHRTRNGDTAEYWQRLAKRGHRPCDVCGEPDWIFGRTGMCFTCTTGKADASGDYELSVAQSWPRHLPHKRRGGGCK